MTGPQLPEGIVYTETVVFAAPARYAAEAPYQIAIIDLAGGARRTVRILAKEARDRVHIGDAVVYVGERNGVTYYCKRL